MDNHKEILMAEAKWLDTAHKNSVNKGYSEEYRKGFKTAAGWVLFHAENTYFHTKLDEERKDNGSTI